jgi:hypothetical protein
MENENKLIAEFIGMQNTNNGWCDSKDVLPNIVRDTFQGNTFDHLLFNKSWDWLMPVVEKIEDIRFDNEDKDSFVSYHRYDVDNRGIGCAITDVQEGKVVGCGDCATKRESTYQAVVEFIKFYNEQNK